MCSMEKAFILRLNKAVFLEIHEKYLLLLGQLSIKALKTGEKYDNI